VIPALACVKQDLVERLIPKDLASPLWVGGGAEGRGTSDTWVTGHVPGACGLADPHCWVRDNWDTEIRQTSERRRSNIEPPVACPFYNFVGSLRDISRSWREQAISLKTPRTTMMSEMAILQQLCHRSLEGRAAPNRSTMRRTAVCAVIPVGS
jgi:hypothetical protein